MKQINFSQKMKEQTAIERKKKTPLLGGGYRKRYVLRKLAKILILAGLLTFALYLRRYTFWLPHWKGDQNHYISLALKLDRLGFNHFNLRGINLRSVVLDFSPEGILTYTPGLDEEGITLVFPRLSENIREKGMLLESLDEVGITYYDQPFFHKPPALPYALALSHRMFAQRNQPYIVQLSNIGRDLADNLDLRVIFGFREHDEDLEHFYKTLDVISKTQFWAVIVPLFFSMGLILLTFVLGRDLFSFRTGLYATFMMAINPVSIMTSQKVLADDMLAFFMVLSVILFLRASKSEKAWPMAFPAGISCGIAVLAKQTGGAVLISVALFAGILVLGKIIRERGFNGLKKAFPNIMGSYLFALGTFSITGFWFLKIYREFGEPLWIPAGSGGGWSGLISSRPGPFLFFLLGVPYLSPLFIPAIFSLRDLFREFSKKIIGKDSGHKFLFLWINVGVFICLFATWQEHRRLLPVYPFIAVLAGVYFDRFGALSWGPLKITREKYFKEAVIVALFFLSIFWTAPRGIDSSLEENMFIRDSYPQFLKRFSKSD